MITNVGVLQPAYPTKNNTITPLDTINAICEEIEKVGSDLDLIVLPEYSNCTGHIKTSEIKSFIGEHTKPFLFRLSDLAAKGKTNIAVNLILKKDDKYYNSTLLIDTNGKIQARYDKTHLTEAEMLDLNLTHGCEPTYVDIDEVRLTFATCLEMYFAEYFEKLATCKPDIIIVPSYQRSETSKVIRIQTMARALDVEAFVARSSFSMGLGSETGGSSMIVDPSGNILIDAEQNTGMFTAKINPKQKRLRPAAHGRPLVSSRDVVEKFRRPELYRPAGPGTK